MCSNLFKIVKEHKFALADSVKLNFSDDIDVASNKPSTFIKFHNLSVILDNTLGVIHCVIYGKKKKRKLSVYTTEIQHMFLIFF